MRQAGFVRPDDLWGDHEWEETGAPGEETTPTASPTRARPPVPAPPDQGVQNSSRAIAPNRSGVASERPARRGSTRPGAGAPGSIAQGVPARSGVIAPTRSRADALGRPALGGAYQRGAAPSATEGVASRTVRASAAALPGQGVPGRRTVKIQGRGAERNLLYSSRRPQRRPSEHRHERVGFKPDRLAMWAVLLGVLLILVAATSSHAAVRSRAAGGSHTALRSRAAGGSHAAVGSRADGGSHAVSAPVAAVARVRSDTSSR
jgi:hypothetical protein